jgi:hypothetical protein
MAKHRFVYTVSGINLSDEQRARISQAIGVAVSQALTLDAPGTVKTDFLNVHRIYGGLWIDVLEAEKVGIESILTAQASGAGPNAP